MERGASADDHRRHTSQKRKAATPDPAAAAAINSQPADDKGAATAALSCKVGPAGAPSPMAGALVSGWGAAATDAEDGATAAPSRLRTSRTAAITRAR
jgi:hypothetical protein